MLKDPQGQKRPADASACAVMVAKIATGEIEDAKRDPTKNYARQGGLKGGPARAEKLSAKKRSATARKAARARYSKDH